MDDAVLGIDFGTSNTVAALSISGTTELLTFDGQPSLPSAVYLQDNGSLVVGRDAERLARLAPERFEPNPKRRIDDVELLLGIDVIGVRTAFAAVLQRVAGVAATAFGGRAPTRVNLTHPAGWGTNRRRLLSAAAREAGLGDVTLIPEPIAAATHFGSMPGRTLPAGSVLAVYDLGGGTFDCAVVEATATGYLVLAEGGLPDVGGVDFDQSVLEHLGRAMSHIDTYHWQSLAVPQTAAARRESRRLREDIRIAKESLSRVAQTDVPLPDPFPDALLTRGEVEGLIRPAIVRTVTQLQRTLRQAERVPEQLAGIYLVGGSSRIPLVAAVIADRIGVVPVSLEEPETTVALGAALARGVTTNKSGPMPTAPPRHPPTPVHPPHAGTGTGAMVVGLPAELSRSTTTGPPSTDRPAANHPATPGQAAPTAHRPLNAAGGGSAGNRESAGPIAAVPSAAELRAAAGSAGRPSPASAPNGLPPSSGPSTPDRWDRPPGGESEELASARLSVARLIGSSAPRRPPRAGWWIAALVVAVMVAVVVEIVAMSGNDDTASAPPGADAIGSTAGQADCPGPTEGSTGPGPCLQEATARARAGALPLTPVEDQTKIDDATRAMISLADPVDQVSLSGRISGSGPELMATFVQLKDAAARDGLFGRMVEDLPEQAQPYGEGKWSGRMVQTTADGQPRIVCMLDSLPLVIQFSPVANSGEASATASESESMSADELADLFADEVIP